MIDHPLRGRFNAFLLDLLEGYMHRKYGVIKQQLFANLPAVVVELGPGTGANLRYLPPNTTLIAYEPNRQMHAKLFHMAKQRGIKLDLRTSPAEVLDLDSASVDFVFCTLVLCTVSRPEEVLLEVKRILRSGGRFICIEHIAAATNSPTHRLQRFIARPWSWLFEGCDVCRTTDKLLHSAGFARVNLKRFILPTIFLPLRHQLAAICTK
ncbi:MAG: class I SAM-dependent methyltransferase [Oligoflexia bacterium]|nr:class I SAM-dependent methyltransferase [Oligoflexia bacterium]MBF0367603.1 class I SAM-dependent methyltransferase [Oligoflexia bacterium]